MIIPRYKPIIYFLGRYKRLYGGILLLILVTSTLESFSVVAFFPVFSSLLGDSQDEFGGILGLVNRLVDVIPVSDPIVAASVLLIGVLLAKAALILIRDVLIGYSSARVMYDVRRQVMERYAGAHYQFFLDNKQGTLTYNLQSAPGAIGSLLMQVPLTVALALKIVSIAVVLALIFPLAALALAILALVYYWGIHQVSRRLSFRLGKGKADASIEQNVIANEFINGIRQIIALCSVGRWADRFDRENRTYRDLHAKHLASLAVPRPLMELSAVGLMLGFLLILRVVSPGDFANALPRLGVFAVSLVQLLPALTSLGRLRMEMMSLLPVGELAYRAITDPVPRRKDGYRVLESFENALVFEGVSFAHKGRSTLMKDFNLAIEKGKVTAIVGPSGAGKTTIINLILGLFEPSHGRITVDEVPLEELNQDSWLRKIGFVSQDLFTYHASVAENILFGRSGYSTESVIKAARIANAHEFISQLPEGYDTVVGDRGMKLSGGQQQRLAIARAMLDAPDILIFDEATSSLDAASEKLVQEAIDNVSADRTVIIVAHRLSSVRHADKIVVLEEGQVVEEGSHMDLLDKRGHYSRLMASSR